MSTVLRDLLITCDPQALGLDFTKRRILDTIAACRSEALGGRILRCPHCGAQVVLYNRCNQRGCPECARAVRQRWRHRMNERLLQTDHYHVVFSGPAALTEAWRREPHEVIDSLFAAVRKTMRTESKRCGLRFGYVAQFHSHGEGLCYKPHLHCLITAGGMDGAGRWQSDHRLNEKVLRVDFVRRILEETGKRLSPRVACEVHTGRGEWGVYVTLHRRSPEALVGYFARSLHGVVCGSEEGVTVTDDEITVDGRHGSSRGVRTLSRAEFLRRYLAHIPPWKAVTVRHYGLYATRSAVVLESARSQVATDGGGSGSEEVGHDGEEVCPHCTTPMLVAYIFRPYEVPALLTRMKRVRGSPVGHGECIRIEEITA